MDRLELQLKKWFDGGIILLESWGRFGSTGREKNDGLSWGGWVVLLGDSFLFFLVS